MTNRFSRILLLNITGALLLALTATGFAADKPKPRGLRVTTDGEISVFVLDDRGAVRGLVLTDGDQVRFSPIMGDRIKSLAKPGDKVSVRGHTGKSSAFGVALEADEIRIRDQVVRSAAPRPATTAVAPPPDLHVEGTSPSPGSPSETPPPPAAATDMAMFKEQESQPRGSYAPSEPLEAMSATGAVAVHLVNPRGDMDGLILSGGEQIPFGPKEGRQIAAVVNGNDIAVKAEGHGLHTPFGTVIHAEKLTIGDQTFTMEPRKPPTSKPGPQAAPR
ncbi:MAG: hypothetical protein U1F68_02320 [Gammaproteobacteria bacterium]